LIGGLAALVALAAGILASVEPVTIVLRAALAFMLGAILTQMWYVFFTVRVTTTVQDTFIEPAEVDETPSGGSLAA
jgi:hypothetical protein